MTGVIIEAFNGPRGLFGQSKKRANPGCDVTNINKSEKSRCKDPSPLISNSNSSGKSTKQSRTDDNVSAAVKFCRTFVHNNKYYKNIPFRPRGNTSTHTVTTVGESDSESSPAASIEESIGSPEKTTLTAAILEQAKHIHDHEVGQSVKPTESVEEDKSETTANAKNHKIDDAQTDSEVVSIKNPGSPEKDEIARGKTSFSPPDLSDESPSDPISREENSGVLDGTEGDDDGDVDNNNDKLNQSQGPTPTGETQCTDLTLEQVLPQNAGTGKSEHVPDQTRTGGTKSTNRPQKSKSKRALSKICAKIIAIPRSFRQELNWDYVTPQQQDPNKIKYPRYIRRIGTEYPMEGDGLFISMTDAEKLEFAAKMRKT